MAVVEFRPARFPPHSTVMPPSVLLVEMQPGKLPWLLRLLEHRHHTVPATRVPSDSLNVVPDFGVLAVLTAQRTVVCAHGYGGHGPAKKKKTESQRW